QPSSSVTLSEVFDSVQDCRKNAHVRTAALAVERNSMFFPGEA
ncbi:MAG: hypothetical protein QOF56_583, partial [Acidobacteriaceae bacterium]|nr:hypothetical protein [Acidobacteriaceae bacterium]